MVDKALRYTLLCVCYVVVWCAPVYLVTCFLCVRLVCTNLSGYVADNVTRQIGTYQAYT
jgi:hypothetical protein